MFPTEVNTTSAGKKSQALHRVLMGVNQMLQNTDGGGNGMGGGKGTTAAPRAGHQKGAGRGSTGWSALTESMKMFGPAAFTQEFLKKLLKWQADVGGIRKSAPRLKYKRWKRQICGYLWVW